MCQMMICVRVLHPHPLAPSDPLPLANSPIIKGVNEFTPLVEHASTTHPSSAPVLGAILNLSTVCTKMHQNMDLPVQQERRKFKHMLLHQDQRVRIARAPPPAVHRLHRATGQSLAVLFQFTCREHYRRNPTRIYCNDETT